MTPAQHASYFRLFNDVFKHLKIPPAEREAFRKETHRKVFGEPISAKLINRTGDFDRIKARLQMLLDNVQGAIETDHPDEGEKRRLLAFIHMEQFILLRVLLSPLPWGEGQGEGQTGSLSGEGQGEGQTDSLSGASLPLPRGEGRGEGQTDSSVVDPVARYLTPLLKNKYKIPSLDHLDTLSAPRLQQLKMDLARAIQTKRKAKAWTVHQLYTAAGLRSPSSRRGHEALNQPNDNVPF